MIKIIIAVICVLKQRHCQTPGYVLRLGVNFVLPLSQQEEEQEPLTKIYQKGLY